MNRPRYLSAGDSALVVEFGARYEPRVHARVVALDGALAHAPLEGLRECVPTYRSLMIHYDPCVLSRAALVAHLDALEGAAEAPRSPRVWRVPACYDDPHGEDLDEVADLLGLDRATIVAAHAQADYDVVMYGFAPGFLFLAGLPEQLAISRRRTPRPPAPPGALTIANGQALIASVAMPTGWYMLGRTPARTFDPRRDPAFPIAVGDRVRFERIDADRFAALEREGGDALAVIA